MINFIICVITALIIYWAVKAWIRINSTPLHSKWPCLTFKQFIPIYNVAPEKWKLEEEYGGFHLEYTATEKNPNYEDELKYYQTRLTATTPKSWIVDRYISPPEKYISYINQFTILHGECNKFIKFFKDVEKRKQDKKNDEAMMDCLKYWREDARIAQEKAQKELNQAQENFNEIANRLKESGDEVKFIYQMEEIV